jgi:SAM-dependent methyltransferase
VKVSDHCRAIGLKEANVSKENEIQYVQNMSKVLAVDESQVRHALLNKPWNVPRASRYFLDFGQILQLIPPIPAKVLDLGVGPGWTSIFLARCGYEVLGLDIAPDMVRIAADNASPGLSVNFLCCDYETDLPAEGFDAVLIYDALHHATDEGAVIRNAYKALREGGIFITAEPGAGHSIQSGSLEAARKFGTTEKDMEFERQLPLMRNAGFREVRQYLRLSELPLVPINSDAAAEQLTQFSGLAVHTTQRGLTSVIVAVK